MPPCAPVRKWLKAELIEVQKWLNKISLIYVVSLIFDEAPSHNISRRRIIKLQTSETSSANVSYTIPPRHTPRGKLTLFTNEKRKLVDVELEFYLIKCKLKFCPEKAPVDLCCFIFSVF